MVDIQSPTAEISRGKKKKKKKKKDRNRRAKIHKAAIKYSSKYEDCGCVC